MDLLVQSIEDAYRITGCQKFPGKMRTDKAGAPGYQNLGFHKACPLQCAFERVAPMFCSRIAQKITRSATPARSRSSADNNNLAHPECLAARRSAAKLLRDGTWKSASAATR